MEPKKQHPTIVNNYTFNAPIGTYIQSVETLYIGATEKKEPTPKQGEIPTDEEMSVAIQKTVHDGMWWSNRAWGVVYRIYQIMGYRGGYSDFISVAEKWGVDTGFMLNYDAIQKPVTSGKYDNKPDMWNKQGAPDAAAILGQALLNYLEPPKADSEKNENSG